MHTTDSAHAGDAGQSPDKRRATLSAELAMHGIALIGKASSGFTAHRWALSVDLADLDDVEAFARRVGAKS